MHAGRVAPNRAARSVGSSLVAACFLIGCASATGPRPVANPALVAFSPADSATLAAEVVNDDPPPLQIGNHVPPLDALPLVAGSASSTVSASGPVSTSGTVSTSGPVSASGIVVIELWATWCTSCVDAMGHLSTLAERYAGRVSFAAVNVLEDGTRQQRRKRLETFLSEHGGNLRFPVWLDPDDASYPSWVLAAGRPGIPATFVVVDGHLAWVGQPEDLDGPLAAVVAGRWDVVEARRLAATERRGMAYLKRVATLVHGDATSVERAYRLADALTRTHLRHTPLLLAELARAIQYRADLPDRWQRLGLRAITLAIDSSDAPPDAWRGLKTRLTGRQDAAVHP